jgi:ribosome maturation factor RimP
MSELQQTIETRLAAAEPGVEVLLVERAGGEIRVYIDHPGGVDLELCERVTGHLRELLVESALTVSSPGADRPLTRPEHFRRYLGRRVRVRTREAIEGRKSFAGRLAAADDAALTVESDGVPVRIDFDRIHRSNLVPELPGGTR